MKASKTKQLGQLQRVELQDFWEDEARDFTPWLAQPENLSLLGEAIGMDLEIEGSEIWVGDFRVDIVARDVLTNRKVVIENQLEKTNHGHLGQLLTYAAGHDAVAVVWVAKAIREEHRSALDWLNERTTEQVGFFGLEIELWRIGESNPAPKFNLVSQPNEWQRAVRPSTENGMAPTETKLLQKEFWEQMTEYFESKGTFLSLRKARPQHWYEISIGRSNFHLSLTLNTKAQRIACELYIADQRAKVAFAKLMSEKTAIEKELGAALQWQGLPHRSASRIIQTEHANLDDRESWPKLFAWLKDRSEAFHRVFSKRVVELDLDEAA